MIFNTNKLVCNMSATIEDEHYFIIRFSDFKQEYSDILAIYYLVVGNKNLGRLTCINDQEYIKKIDLREEFLSEIHTNVILKHGKQTISLLPKYTDNSSNFPAIYAKVVYQDSIYALRCDSMKKTTILSQVPTYEFNNEIEDEVLSTCNFEKKYILFYEKRSESIGESSFIIFDKYYKDNPEYVFILSGAHERFEELKKLYGDQLILKGSKRYYEVIYNAKLLVSSEFPTHVAADRNVEYALMEHVFKLPSIFLQHGIMFSKPIDNPNAAGFWKKNIKFNLKKTVVSSDLEKEEFYKVGYTDEDLIKTGLATFDDMDTEAIKDMFVYMPTYRAWEEYMVYNDQIEQTTYYQDIIGVINSFKEIGQLDKLTIIPHPKFAKYFEESSVNFGCKFETSYTECRDNVKLLITDLSSVCYDAQYRGAYIIYLWNRIDEIQDNLQAKMPLNSRNVNGVPVNNFSELKYELLMAEKLDYKMEEFYEHNFRAICELNDGENSARIKQEIDKLLGELYA